MLIAPYVTVKHHINADYRHCHHMRFVDQSVEFTKLFRFADCFSWLPVFRLADWSV